MKQIVSIILILSFSRCSIESTLNQKIDKSQKASLMSSPFETALGINGYLKIQKEFRKQYEKVLDSLILKNLNDTIILTENYDFICFGCPADYVQVVVDSMLITYEKNTNSKNYKNKQDKLSKNFIDSKGYVYDDLLEIKNEIKNNDYWNSHPEKYGTDDCVDGGHTFYTVIYPSGKITSMYIRCWVPKEYRIIK